MDVISTIRDLGHAPRVEAGSDKRGADDASKDGSHHRDRTTDYTLCLTVGGIACKPGMVRDRGRGERIEPREVLSLTISTDHDLIDGAPAARFAVRLKEINESGAILARTLEETHKIQPSPDRQPLRDTVGFTVVEERQTTGT